MPFFIIFCILGLWCSSLSSEGLIVRDKYTPMKISIIVPCHFKHFPYIHELLNCFSNQTVLPDEIVISLSEAGKISSDEISAIENSEWPFKLTIVQNQDKMNAGKNRNTACANSSGDLIICQDADDIPHPQRVEIIKILFETYEIDHLLHYWTRSPFVTYSFDEVFSRCFSIKKLKPSLGDITYGNPAFTREVWKKIKWTEKNIKGEDVQFNLQAYNQFQRKLILNLPLLNYRSHLSSFSTHENQFSQNVSASHFISSPE